MAEAKTCRLVALTKMRGCLKNARAASDGGLFSCSYFYYRRLKQGNIHFSLVRKGAWMLGISFLEEWRGLTGIVAGKGKAPAPESAGALVG
ncbi:hypothetical protein [Granulicella paludicola]|uniref:hypothetical protein n=1 Tax=Granulicella paludicola TaxID=474951 RepID=UPI0021E09C04|nr:hypothetical protein [Granulicella paludicola]